jgi:DNA repair exonuclease SbcCD nuclease subunit
MKQNFVNILKNKFIYDINLYISVIKFCNTRRKNMRFVHIADMHFDSPFTNLADKEGLGDIRRLEQRKALKKIIDYIKENEIPYLFISGDLYEQKYIRKSTIEYINKLFCEIPNTRIFISPGNHDPFIKNSYYNQFNWNKNVHIFKSKIEKIELDEADIYGYGFTDFYCTDCGINNFVIENKEKINILIMHASLDGVNAENGKYNSIAKNILKEKEFNYCALGHIHKLDYNNEINQNIVYPGSTVSQGFDELGEHGMIVGNIEKNNISLNFVKLDETEFKEIELDCTDLISVEELIEKINNLDLKNNELYKIILTGKRNFEINIYDLFKLNLDEKIIKIKNKTKQNYDLEKMINDTTLKGLFAKEMLEKLKNAESEEEKEIIEKAIEIGIEVLE